MPHRTAIQRSSGHQYTPLWPVAANTLRVSPGRVLAMPPSSICVVEGGGISYASDWGLLFAGVCGGARQLVEFRGDVVEFAEDMVTQLLVVFGFLLRVSDLLGAFVTDVVLLFLRVGDHVRGGLFRLFDDLRAPLVDGFAFLLRRVQNVL